MELQNVLVAVRYLLVLTLTCVHFTVVTHEEILGVAFILDACVGLVMSPPPSLYAFMGSLTLKLVPLILLYIIASEFQTLWLNIHSSFQTEYSQIKSQAVELSSSSASSIHIDIKKGGFTVAEMSDSGITVSESNQHSAMMLMSQA